jgi:hypothetical protein
MKEIKFRAWDYDGRRMSRCVTLQQIAFEPAIQIDFRNNAPHLYWMQFTGLTDKNGVEVFEGDLVRATPDGYAPHEIYEVKWHEKDCGWVVPKPLGDYVVIGNIYENPELLSKSQ